MAKTRLNADKRTALTNHALSLLDTTDLDKQIDDAVATAAQMVYDFVAAEYPQDEMQVLVKYQVAFAVSGVDVRNDTLFEDYAPHKRFPRTQSDAVALRRNPQWVNILPSSGDKIPLPVGRSLYAPRGASWDLPKKLVAERPDIVEAVNAAREKWLAKRAAVDQYMAPYRRLVREARYLEDVIEVWPDADGAVLPSVKHAMASLSPADKARIAADVAARADGTPPLAGLVL